MITKVNSNGRQVLAISMPGVNTMADVAELRGSLQDVLETCLSSDECKDRTGSVAMWQVACLIRVLTDDIEGAAGGEDA